MFEMGWEVIKESVMIQFKREVGKGKIIYRERHERSYYRCPP